MANSIVYIARTPNLRYEKSFTTDFPIDHINGVENLRGRNVDAEDRKVHVQPVQDASIWDLDVHGFCFLQAATVLDPDLVYTDRKDLQPAFWYQIEAILHERFPQYSRIEAFDLKVRKRDPEFPLRNRTYRQEYENPARSAHVDFSQKGSLLVLEQCFPDQSEYWENKDFDMINVWRPLRGPSDDWPLAVCDYTTVDPENDIVLNDSIRRDFIGENSLLHFNPAHRWYYMKNQGVDNLLVFRNSDSSGKRARGFHAAFNNPASTGPPRESVEVRLAAFY